MTLELALAQETSEASPSSICWSTGDETFEADPETERMLLDAIAQCERGETIPLPAFWHASRGTHPKI